MRIEKVACYCRVSTRKEEQLISLEHQKEFFQQFIANNPKYELYEMYVDEGISGKSLKKRKEFNRMVTDAKKGLFSTILVKDISRFARNTVDTLDTVRDLKKNGTAIEFITYSMDTLGNSEFVLTVLAAIAQEESYNLSNRVKFGKKQGAKQGRVPSRVYGYDKVKGDKCGLTINQAEAAIVRRVFDLYVNCQMSSHQIAKLFNEECVLTKNAGRLWSQTVICGILKNRLYIGQVCNGKSEVKDFISGNRAKYAESEWIVVERPEYRIIPDEVFIRAQELVESRGNSYHQFEDDGKTKRKRPSVKHPLSNLLVCANDNYAYRRRIRTYKPGGYTYTYWTCSKRDFGVDACGNAIKLDERQMHEAIRQFLVRLFDNKDMIYRQFRATVGRRLKEKYAEEIDRDNLITERNKLEKDREKLMDLYLKDEVNKEYITAKINPIESRLDDIEATLDILRNRDNVVPDIETCLSKMVDKIANTDELMDNAFLKELFERFIVHADGRITAVLKIDTGTGVSLEIPFGEMVDKSEFADSNALKSTVSNCTDNI